MFGVVPKSIWNTLNPADENNLCTWALRCLLIEDGDKLILIDTGIGDKQSEKFFSHYYLHGNDSLEKSILDAGYHFSDVTDVILTHLHFDHVGGAISKVDDKLQLTFPNAQYWSNSVHWDWAVKPNPREKASFLPENILPIQENGRLNFIEKGDASPFENISFKYVNGHTMGQMLPIIKYNDRVIAYCADLLPSAGHLKTPYIMAYDMQPLMSMKEKVSFLDEALEKDYILFFEHDPKIECATVTSSERGIIIDRKGKLVDILA